MTKSDVQAKAAAVVDRYRNSQEVFDRGRPDLIEAWYAAMKCVKTAELRGLYQVFT